MAVPKRKLSRSRRDSRRAQWMRSVNVPTAVPCPRCEEPKLPHRVCESCGYYHDKQIIPQAAEDTGE